MPGQELSVTEQLERDLVTKTLLGPITERAEKDKAIADSMKRLADMKAEFDKADAELAHVN